MNTFIRQTLIVTILVFTMTGFSWRAAAGEPAREEKIEAVRVRYELLKSTVGALNKNRACDGDGQCDVLETGSRLCGGPSGFLIVSLSNPSLSTLKTKIAEMTSVEKELNLVEPPRDCSPAPHQPEVHCVKNLCSDLKPNS